MTKNKTFVFIDHTNKYTIEKNVDLWYTGNVKKCKWGIFMKLTKQSKTKLDLIRIEGLCKLILSKYDEDDIISKISNVTKTIPIEGNVCMD